MLPQTIEFTHAGVTYTFTLKGRVSLLLGLSATGKTTFIRNITKPGHAGRPSVAKTLNVSRDASFAHEKDLISTGDIVFLDEDAVRQCRLQKCMNALWNMPVYLVFACREPLFEIKLAYTDIYELITNVNTKRTEFVQLYNSYTVLPSDTAYFCEDTKSGYQYYSSRLVNVTPTEGVKNCIKHVNDGTLIMDGAAVGQYIPMLEKQHASMFLPMSFEYLVLHRLTGLSDVELLHDYTPIHKSMERYFTWLCEQTKILNLHYSKRRLNSRIHYLALCDELRGTDNGFHTIFMHMNFFYKLDKDYNTLLHNNEPIIVDQMTAFTQLLDFMDCTVFYTSVTSIVNIWDISVTDFNRTIFEALVRVGAFDL
ncbi:MAG: hypothetical protein NC548_29445 [Lachnospiraceae bacterium]|nr:hypothetical protein [Lachnospiraceae bacterium]